MLKVLLARLNRSDEVRQAYRSIFGTPQGEVVLRHLIKHGFVASSTFVAGDVEQTLVNEGSRRVVLSILRMAQVDDAKLAQLIKRNYDEQVDDQVAAASSQ